MAIQLTTQTLVLLIIALVLLGLGLAALASANGLTVPVFQQIADLFAKLGPPKV